jgi:hypothetical protein
MNPRQRRLCATGLLKLVDQAIRFVRRGIEGIRCGQACHRTQLSDHCGEWVRRRRLQAVLTPHASRSRRSDSAAAARSSRETSGNSSARWPLYNTMEIQADGHIITATERLPRELRHALYRIHS